VAQLMSESNEQKDGEQIFANVRLGLDAAACDVVVRGGRITRLERHTREPQWVLLPPLADLHVHANRAYTTVSHAPASLDHAIHSVEEIFRNFSAADYARRAELLFAAAYGQGTTHLRTHADITHVTGLKGIQGTLEAREAFTADLGVDVVAFAGAQYDPVDADVQTALRAAVALGASFLGAVPAYYQNPRASIDALLDLARELGVAVDVHLDEHLDAARSLSGYFAAAVRARGLHGRATLSHGCAMSSLDYEERARVIDALASAQITVICLPTTNLYLQDRQGGQDRPGGAPRSDPAPRLRGLAPLRELARAGVPLRFASDNVRDAFFPYGSADLLDIAQLIVVAGQVDDLGVVLRGICGGRDGIREGEEASFVLVRGGSLVDVIAERPQERRVVRLAGSVSFQY